MKHTACHTALICLIAILPCMLSGCRGKGPPTQYIEGTVTLDGQPVEKALVSFVPVQAQDMSNLDNLNVPLIATGNSDTEGKFRLSAVQGGKIGRGTTIGEYRVTIVKKELLNPPVVKDGKVIKPMNGPPKFQYVVPKAFEDPKKSDIVVTVKKGANRFEFALNSDGSANGPFEK